MPAKSKPVKTGPAKPKSRHLTLRLPPEEFGRLEALAERTGRSRSQAAREALMREVDDADGRQTAAEVADRDELLRLLTRKSRAGNVGAMARLLDELRRADEDDDGKAGKPVDPFDELAERRKAG